MSTLKMMTRSSDVATIGGGGGSIKAATSLLLSYSSTLCTRCQRVYGWDSTLVNRVWISYVQFLDLKVILEDFDAQYLSPSFLVDQMWHQHLLDNRHYEQFCIAVCGRQIYHDPEGGDDVLARQMRVRTTQSALKTRFNGVIDRMVWDMSPSSSSTTAAMQRQSKRVKKRKRSIRSSAVLASKSLSLSSTPYTNEEQEDDDDEPLLTIWLDGSSSSPPSSTPQQDQEMEFQVMLPSRTRTRMAYVYKLCARQMGISNSGDILLCYANQDGSIIPAKRRGYLEYAGLIGRGMARLVCTYNPRPVAIRIVNHDVEAAPSSSTTKAVVALERSSKVQDLYKAYSTEHGMPLGSFDLRYQGRKLFSYNTPRALQWFDHVEVECQHRLVGTDPVGMSDCEKNDGNEVVGTTCNLAEMDNGDDNDASTATTTWDDGDDDDSSIDVGFFPTNAPAPTPGPPMPVTVKVRHQSGEERSYQVHETTRMQSIFLAQAQTLGVKGSDLRFLLDGERIDPNQTPAVLELVEGDVIDCMMGGRAC